MVRFGAFSLLSALAVSSTGAFRLNNSDSEVQLQRTEEQNNRSAAEEQTRLNTFKILQWNPHWECFTPGNMGRCGHHAMGALSAILPEMSIDLANVIEINERSDFYSPPAPFRIMNARCGNPVMDSSSIIYDSSKWTPVGGVVQGCMHHNDRAFIIQTFRNRASSEKVVFVGAHFPHSASNGNLKRAAEAEMHRHKDALGVIFAADVNREEHVPTEHIVLGDVHSAAHTVGAAAKGRITSATKHPSCCRNDGFVHHYDRVAANFAHRVDTQMLFDPSPWWTNIPGSSFHKAIVATFHV